MFGRPVGWLAGEESVPAAHAAVTNACAHHAAVNSFKEQPTKSLTSVMVWPRFRAYPKPVLTGREGLVEVLYHRIRGQEATKRALTVAAAGGHNVLAVMPKCQQHANPRPEQ